MDCGPPGSSSKTMFKILQAKLQQYMKWELPDVQVGFRKGRGTRDQIANIRWISEKARDFQKNICFIGYTEAFDLVDHNKLWKVLKDMGTPDHLTASWLTYMQNMEQQTGSKLGKEYSKAVYCHPAYSTYM